MLHMYACNRVIRICVIMYTGIVIFPAQCVKDVCGENTQTFLKGDSWPWPTGWAS